ncbi:MAG: RIP metalloprotease RseP [Gemmatimonadaceae bacterium]
MLAILAPVLVFGLVIFVHEFGHFLAAKAVGVYAPRFSIGFGPPIFKFRRGETEYVLAWLPLGGYVRMASRHDAETAFLEGGNEESAAIHAEDPEFDPNAMIPFGPKPVPEDRWFESKSLGARIVIMLAGVFMNVVLAFVVASTLEYTYQHVILPTTVIGRVDTTGAPPEMSRLHAGDSIRAVNGTPTHDWGAVLERIEETSGSTLILTTQRGDVTIPVAKPMDAPQRVAMGLQYYMAPIIDSVLAGEPAARANLKKGDSVVSVSGTPVSTWPDLVDRVAASAGKPLVLGVSRGGVIDTVTVTPREAADTNRATGEVRTVGRMGAMRVDRSHLERVSVGAALVGGWRTTMSYAGMVFKIVHGIGTGDVSVRELGGPIAITRQSVTEARRGLGSLFNLIALLSVNVAILNLLPIPILDGGQILINVLETAKGKPFSIRTRENILRFGLVAIGLLFAIVMFNDTRAGFEKLFDWVGSIFRT